MSASILTVLAGVLCAVALGSMVFFAAVMAPLIFTRLPMDVSGPFIREVFPWYYLALAAVTGVAALVSWPSDPANAVLLGAVCLGFVYARQSLMPRINALRDQEQAGNPEAGTRFARAHRASVVLNTLQIVCLLIGVVRFQL